jgi:Domain of unknown function (DUF4918)
MSFASHIKRFNRHLHLGAELPDGIKAMNPFTGDNSATVLLLSDAFYDQFYNDEHQRTFIIGINPGRHGAGITGVPFTDFKRLRDECGIDPGPRSSHEPSSEFVYRMIHAVSGSVAAFYSQFYINSLCPLGFIKERNGKWVNYNYYDDKQLTAAVEPFMVQCLKDQIAFGVDTTHVFCMGKENAAHLNRLNDEHGLFHKITILPHPRYVVQYKRKEMDRYLSEYRQLLLN